MANLYIARIQWYNEIEKETMEVHEVRAAESLGEATERIAKDYDEESIIVCEIHPLGNDSVLIPNEVAHHIIKEDFKYDELYTNINYD